MSDERPEQAKLVYDVLDALGELVRALSTPVPINPQDEQARLVRTVREASEVLRAATERLDKLGALQAVPVRAVS
jgi:hypothetical protein